MHEELWSQINSDIVTAYGSTESPNFTFVTKRFGARPYSSLISAIGNRFQLSETTDLNDDTCIALVLSQSSQRWSLDLSLVGKYAMLGRVRANNTVEALTIASTDIDANEVSILEMLRDSDITVLPLHMLIQRVPFNMQGEGDDKSFVTLFQVLFSSDSPPF